MLRRASLFFLLLAIILPSCETFDPKVEPAAYLYVEPFEADTVGVDAKWKIKSHKITDVWVYLDESQFQGAYELPAIIPVTANGTQDLLLRPGIKNAGVSTIRAIYPYYKEYRLDGHNFRPNYVDSITPFTKYDQSQTIYTPWYENFETFFSSWDYHPGSDTILNLIDDPQLVFDGKYSGQVFLAEDDIFFELISTPPMEKLPRSNIPIYLELNYKSNHKFQVGLYSDINTPYRKQIPIYTVKEQSDWNKIYLDMTEYVLQNQGAFDFTVFIGISKEDGFGEVELYLDNIKLIHY